MGRLPQIHRKKGAQEDLVRAACQGDARLARTAIRHGANVNARYWGRPILFWAIQEEHLNVVRILVYSGASPERRDNAGFTPLDQAVGAGNFRIVQWLLDAGAKVNVRTCNGSVLHTACAYRRLKIVRLLLKHGADPSVVDDEGREPAAFAKLGKTNRTDTILQNLLREAVLKGIVKSRKNP